jgi:hypothetical protein
MSFISAILFPCRFFVDLDGKIGAHHGAEPAAGALAVGFDLRRAISFCVQPAAGRKSFLGTEGNAQAASFAAFGIEECS